MRLRTNTDLAFLNGLLEYSISRLVQAREDLDKEMKRDFYGS